MKNRSLFWPFVLIAVGTLWILISMSIIPAGNLWALVHTWPVLLIAAGVGLILQPRWPTAGIIISAVVVAGMVLAVVFAPQLGWNNPSYWAFEFDGGGFGGSVRGSGVMASETREVAAFDTVRLEFPAEVTVEQGESTSITIEAEDNLLPQLETRVSGGVLTIDNDETNWNQRVSPTRGVDILITTPDLNEVNITSAGTLTVNSLQTDNLKINISGAGDVTLADLDAESLEIRLSGAGDISADGAADDFSLHISGMGNFDGEDLETQTAEVNISGAGDASVWVIDELEAKVSGAGSVSYYGSPSVDRSVSGVGSIDSLGEK